MDQVQIMTRLLTTLLNYGYKDLIEEMLQLGAAPSKALNGALIGNQLIVI